MTYETNIAPDQTLQPHSMIRIKVHALCKRPVETQLTLVVMGLGWSQMYCCVLFEDNKSLH